MTQPRPQDPHVSLSPAAHHGAMESQRLSLLNPHPTKIPGPSLLHHLVAAASDSIAVEYLLQHRVTQYSYRQLHDASDILAARLSLVRGQAQGRFIVPVLIRQSPQLYISLLAILKAGGAFCPLNPDDPPARISFVLKDVSARVVVVSRELAHLIPYHEGIQVLQVDSQDDAENIKHVQNQIPAPEDLAYVMYTSGSTGIPKGVGISHLAASQALLAHDRHIPSFSRFLQFAASTFDIFVFEIFFTLFRGCTLIGVDRSELLNDLPAVLREMNVDACELTPTVAASLLRSRTRAPNLKLLLTIGEMLNESVVREFGGDDLKDSLLWAMYGPTEATIHCTLQAQFPSTSSTHNIGMPLDTVSCFVIDPASTPDQNTMFKILPRGEIGELAIGGHQLADGYLNRPDQTLASFISSPYGRVYRTGDRARMNIDGSLECLGRISEGQIKLNGQRLELGEVEAALLRTPGCHGAVAAVLDSILVVFCAVDAGVTEANLMGYCKRWLPQYMTPGVVVVLGDFPRLPSGKVDKKKLQSDFQASKYLNTQDDGLTTAEGLSEMEEKLLEVTSHVLSVEVTKQTMLASVGVDSLKAIGLASALRSAGFEINAAQLLAFKTVSDLCSSIRPKAETRIEPAGSPGLSILNDLDRIVLENPALGRTRLAVEDVLPCLALQTAMLAETARHPEAYWNDIELEVKPGSTIDKLSSAVLELARQNEILRSGFVHFNDEYALVIFKTFDDQMVQIVDSFHGLDVSKPDGLLHPLRIQMLDTRSAGGGTRILLHIHHAIYDGWSMDVALSDLSKLLVGVGLQPRQQFRRFVQFSKNMPLKQSDRAREFWSEHLADWVKQPFPKLSNRPGNSKEILTKEVTLNVPAAMVDQATKETGCSAQVYFQAALALVWGGILGESDVVLGSVLSGRTIPVDDVEGIFGPCIASLPLRIDLAKAQTALDVLISIRSSNRKIMEHSSLPLLEIKKIIGGQTNDNLYDVLFVYQQSLYSTRREQNLIQEVRRLDRLETKLLVEAEPQGNDGFRLQATYHSDSIPSQVVLHILQQVKEVFLQLIGHETGLIHSIRDALKVPRSVDNEVPQSTNSGSDLATLFENAAAKTPHADAICFNTSLSFTSMAAARTVSYENLNKMSNQIAHFLLDQGAEPGHVVAIIMEKSPLLYASILGITKARCAYLPLHPSTPISRLQDIFSSSSVERCLCDKNILHVSQIIREVQFLDLDSCKLEPFSDQNLDIHVNSSRLAYVIYTSGTTGVPKGVAVTQANIVANILHLGSTYPAAKRNPPRLLQACSQAFDVSVFEIFFAWHMGMCLCAAPNDVLFEDIEHAIRQFQITHLSLTPSVASLIEPTNVPNVEFLVTAGEPMTGSVLGKWGELLWQGYGPSETTNICSVKRMKHGEYIEHLGWVFPNTSVVVLASGGLEALPIGWVGELCFGGDQVAAGYLNMPELTAKKFIHHPQLGRLYRSGDMGRMLPDGSLIILGRLDDQIKLRGQRIEAKEVSSIITGTLLAVEAVTTIVSQQPSSSTSSDQLASFYVRQNIQGAFRALDIEIETHQSLFARLMSQLPSYMIPSYMIPLSRIPLTGNGKIDQKSLQSCFASLSGEYLEAASRTTGTHDDDEWTEVEKSIANVLSRSLDIPKHEIGRWTPFAKLGLHSISAIGVARDLKLHFDAPIPISAILRNPTVAQLGRFISTIPLSTKPLPRKAHYFSETFIEQVQKEFLDAGHEVAEVLPCSPLQEAMLSQGRDAYYNKIIFRMHVEPDVIKQCWNALVKRHGILRTCFVTSNDSRYPIAQVVLEKFVPSWKSYTIETLELDEAVRDHTRTLSEPLDTKRPPFSLAIMQNSSGTFLSMICHHALYDGIAMENLSRELESMVLGNTLSAPVPYSLFLQEMLSLPDDTEQFWACQLWGFSPSDVFAPPPFQGQIVQCLHSSSLDLAYDEVQERARSLGSSLLSLCQAAWAQVLSICSKSSDVCFGCVMSGRTLDIDGLDRLIAPCFNTVPVRKDISYISHNAELAKAFQLLTSDLLPYQFTPLRMIQKKVSRAHGGKLFESLLILQLPLQEMDRSIWTLEEDSGEMDIPLVCEVAPCLRSNSVMINIHYHRDVLDEDTATALLSAFKVFFQLILDSPQSALAGNSALPSAVLPLLSKLASKPRIKVIPPGTASSKNDQWTESEMVIRKVLSDLSGAPLHQIRRDTSIYKLGLDSINAVQVASILRRQGLAVSASDVIEHQNCKSLAEKLLQSSGPDHSKFRYDFETFSANVRPQIGDKLPRGIDIEAIIPCSPIQCAMLASFTQSNGEHYLNMVSYALDGNVSKDSLTACWKILWTCHPMLRTGFAPIHHHDSSFAMIRYRNVSEAWTTYHHEQIQELDEGVDVSLWKINMASSMLGSLHLPPWKLAISATSTGIEMHLLIHHALYDARSLDSMLAGLSDSLSGQTLRVFPPVEAALSCILSQSLELQKESQKFWEEKAESMVVNNFPIMTPLRENRRSILCHDIVSSMSFSVLQDATQKQGVSIQAIIQAAWTRVLSSYLGEESVVFGVILSGRTMDETREAPFPCMVTVPIVTMNQSTNKDLVNAMVNYNQELHRHQFVPLGQIQKWLGHPATPVFDTLLVYQKMDRDLTPSRPWRRLNDDASVDYPVSVEVELVDGNAIRLSITFFSDVLPMEQAQLLLRQFDAIMKHIATDPDGHEDEVFSVCSEIFAVTPPTVDVIPAPVEFLHQFVESRALSHPSDPALEFVSGFDGEASVKQTWTYAEFDALGNRMANMLQSKASVGSIIAIHLEKCPEAYISILGILKAGCSFVALDVSAPRSRKEFIIGDSQAPCLLVSSEGKIDFDVNCEILPINLQELINYSPERRDLGADFSPDATCYCLYTSGTTGTPKGCEITHENCVQAMMAFQDLFKGHWQSDSRWLQFAALHFDVSVLEQYWSWSVGITVVAAPRDLILDDLIASINRLKITHIDLTPSLARLTHPDDCPGLSKGVFITGGESLKQEILDAWGPKAVIYNAYGPTEATIGVTMHQRVPVNGRPSNIGKQFLNVGSYVFRSGSEIPVLRGAVGELCVSGKLVGKGYLNRPELTNERFPMLSDFGGERIYRTGDLVRILHDGCFDFLGRADDQVKLRGQRLEIGEINHVIRTGAPEVKDVATLVLRHRSGGKDVLVSFLVGQHPMKGAALAVLLQGHEDLGARAREACRAKLPSYMVPSYFLALPFIPLSPNNKVEAKELKRLFNGLSPEELLALMAALPSSRRANTEIMTKTTEILAEFCQLNKDSITESTSIFDLGIDSITALRVSTLFKSRDMKSCSPALLLRNPIVADLSAELSKHHVSISTASLVQEVKQTIQAFHHRYLALICRALAVQPHDVEYIAPCSALQQGIISKSATSEFQGTYFNSFELTLEGNISVERLKLAWDELVISQAILRTCFVKTADGYVQTALRGKDLLYWREQRMENGDDMKVAVQAARQEWIERNRDEFKKPFELVLVTGPETRKKLLIHIFHALYDGISFDLMMHQIQATYRHGRLPTLPLEPSFLEALCHGPLWRYDESLDFWATHLQYWKPSPMPRLSVSTKENAVQSVRLVSGSALEAVRQRHNVTLQSVVMALWTAVIQQYFSFSDGASIGIIVAGRSMDLLNVENTIGPLFNTVPFFNKSLQGQSWTSLIRKCHDFHTSILPFQHVPLKSIQKLCSGGRPLFDNVFVFGVEQNSPYDGPELWTVEDGPLTPDYPLALEAKQLLSGDIQLCLVAQGQVADVAILEDILNQVENGVALMGADQTLHLQNLPEMNISHQVSPGPVTATNANGLEDDQDFFVWTDQARAIQHAVASLVDVSAEDITATRTMLELGLDSVDIIQLSAKLRSRDINLSASEIMRHQTIAKMSCHVQTLAHGKTAITEEGSADRSFEELTQKLWTYVEGRGVIDMTSVEAVLPPTHLQESMVAGMVHSDFAWYFNHDLLEVSVGTDIQKLRDAWIQVVKSSPILRTGFLEIEDRQLDVGYCQIIYEDSIPTIEEVQVSSLSEVDRLIQRATDHAREKRGLDRLFQLRTIAYQERRFFLVSMAHALYDGWSLGLMYRDLEAAFHGNVRHRVSSRAFIQRLLVSQTRDDARFWTNYMDGASPAMMSETLGSTSSNDEVHRREEVAIKDISEIADFCKKQSISLQTLLQACWAAVLAHRTRSLDISFGIVLSGRDFIGAEDLLFPTMNTVPLRCILHGNSFEFLGYLEATMMDIRDHQSYPMRKIQTPSRIPCADLFNTLCILQKAVIGEASSKPLLKSVDGSSAVDYPVSVEAEATRDGFVWRVACQARFLTQEETQQLVQDLNSVLAFIMRPEPSIVLSFRDNEVSICGLSHVSLADKLNEENKSPLIEDTTTDLQPLSETGLTIRRVLSLVAGLSEESIPASSCSLYHLGLDSISALKVCSLLRKEGVYVNPRDLLKATSITQMARAAFQQLEDGPVPKKPDVLSKKWNIPKDIDIGRLLADSQITEKDFDFILPALPMQVYMITAWQNSQGSVFFPEFQYVINGTNSGVVVNVESVKLAWDSLVAQLPILRTVFLATRSDEIPFLQLALKPESTIFRDGIVKPFVVFQASSAYEGGGVVVRLRIHHALYDGVSLPAIMRQLIEKIHVKGCRDDAETLDGDVRRWSRFAMQPMEEHARQARRTFWTKYLCDVPSTISRGNDAIMTTATASKARISYLKKAALADISPLRSLTFQHGVSIQSLFLAAYAKALIAQRQHHKSNETSSHGEQPEENAGAAATTTVVFGIYLANRTLSVGHETPPLLPSTFSTLNLVPLKVTVAARGDNDSSNNNNNNNNIVKIAQAIQNDIHEISSDNRAQVGLWEIAQWTGIQISSFVNFLGSFVEESEESVDNNIKGSFKQSQDINDNASEGGEPAHSHTQLSENIVKEFFPAAVDVEASIQNQALDIGVFGSQECVSSEGEAAMLVQDIVGYLTRL